MFKSLFLATCLIAMPAAANAEALTEQSIQAFLDQTTRLTHQDNGMSEGEIKAFLNDHIARNGNFSSSIMYDIPGYPSQMRQMALDKDGFITNVLESRKVMQNYTSTTTLKQAAITGNRASIKTDTRESGIAPVAGEEMVPFEGVSSCNQILHDDDGKIILDSVSCETIVTVKEQ